MRIKCGTIITEVTGSLGGHTAQRTKDGLRLAKKTNPLQGSTTSQLTIRSRMSTLTQRWRELTEKQRLRWNTTVYNGLSGFEYFKSYNMLRLICAQSIANIPLFPTKPTSVPSFSLVLDKSSGLMRVTMPFVIPNPTRVTIEATPPLSAGVSNPSKRFKLMTCLAGNGVVDFSFAFQWQARFGTFQTGQTIFVRVYTINSTSTVRSNYLMLKGTVLP
jgi:hypothetical protein